jgi:rhomboid family GlyGly-CTERM serine protease
LIFALPGLTSALEYDRAALRAGELWRLASCHWTHWDGSHLLWDFLTFLILAGLCEALDRRRLLIGLGAAALLIPMAIWAVLPDIGVYRGLSGLDSTLFALYLGLVRSRLRSQGRSGGWTVAALGLLGAKVLYETIAGETLFVTSPGPGPIVVPLAHLVGGVVGWLASGSVGRPGPTLLATGWIGLTTGAARARSVPPDQASDVTR